MVFRRLIGVISVVVAAAGLMWWLRTDFRTPTEVVRAAAAAGEAGDESGVASLTCADNRADAVAGMRRGPSNLKLVGIKGERIDGDRAEVDIIVNYAGADPSLDDMVTVHLVYEGGWRIC